MNLLGLYSASVAFLFLRCHEVYLPPDELSAQLSSVSRAVSSRPNRPVLANILVKADIESQSVTLVGFDEVLGIESRFMPR
jgi:DNA polymerase III sliding clamp (beta) subunit (PCNA family)